MRINLNTAFISYLRVGFSGFQISAFLLENRFAAVNIVFKGQQTSHKKYINYRSSLYMSFFISYPILPHLICHKMHM